METRTPFQQVTEFHKVFGHPVSDKPSIDFFFNQKKIVTFRYNLIIEEINEFVEACMKNDFVEAVDAIADILYVVCGASNVFGFDHDVECAKLNTIDIPSTVVPKDIKTFIPENAKALSSYVHLLYAYAQSLHDFYTVLSVNESDEFMSEENEMIYDLFRLPLVNITRVLYKLSDFMGIDLKGAFAEVHRSNMTKACKSEKEAMDSVEWYKSNETKYSNPNFRKVDNVELWTVFNDTGNKTTSKILKSIYFELPKLEKFCL